MNDNIKIHFNNVKEFEKMIKQSRNFEVTMKSEEIINDTPNASIYPMKGRIGNFIYKIHKSSAYLENSIHKYYNLINLGEETNYNDFTFCQLTQALEDLRNEIPDYDFAKTRITKLEYGFNLKINKSASELINKNILLYRFKPHNIFEGRKGYTMKKFKSGSHTIKIYDKKAESNLDYELLRCELVLNTRELKKLKIDSFLDLYDPIKQLEIFNFFRSCYSKLLVVDNRFTAGLSDEQIDSLGNKLEPTYYLRDDVSSKTIYRQKKKLEDYIKTQKLDKTKNYLMKMIDNKFNELFKDCDGNTPIFATS